MGRKAIEEKPGLPPIYNLEPEQSVLGAILVRPEVLDEVNGFLRPGDFYGEAHRHIYHAMLDLCGKGEPVDLVTVTAHLKAKNQLEGVGGPLFLAGLSEQVGFATNAKYYAQIIRKNSYHRQFQNLLKKLMHEAQRPGANIKEILTLAETNLLELIESANGNDKADNSRRIIPAGELLSRDYPEQNQIIGKGILPAGGGLIIAGESGDGKSLIRTQLAIHLVMGWNIWGLEIPTARRVFVFQFENTEAAEAYRLKKMLLGLGINNFPDNLTFSDPTIRLDFGKDPDRHKAMKIIRESGAEVVIYDPLTSLHSVNENDNVLIRRILDNITEINRKIGTTAILIHHFGKPTEHSVTAHRTRGASSIRDWADTLIAVTRKKHEHKILRLLEFIKVRNGLEPKPMLLERDENFIHHLTEEAVLCPPEKVKEILKSLGGKVEGQERLKKAIMEATGCGDRNAREHINLAIERKGIRSKPNPSDKRKKVYTA